MVNEAYREGRASSLRRGAEAVDETAEAVLILSVDQPRPAWVARGAASSAGVQDRPLIVSPRFGERYGHPVLLDGSLLPELRAVTEETLGLRAVIERHVAEATLVVTIDNADMRRRPQHARGLRIRPDAFVRGRLDDGGR